MGRILLFAMLLLGAGSALAGMEAGLEAGVAAYKRADYVAARTAWAPLATAGDAAAQY